MCARRPRWVDEAFCRSITSWWEFWSAACRGGDSTGLAIALLFSSLVFDPPSGGDRPEHVPTWQVVTGFSISGLGPVFMIVALVARLRGIRRVRGRNSPLYVLTRHQRKELLRQVRGQGPAVPERIRLARHLAELLLVQPVLFAGQAGMMVNFAVLWIAGRETYHLVLVGMFVVLLLVGGVFVQRENRRARRFLDRHPALHGDESG